MVNTILLTTSSDNIRSTLAIINYSVPGVTPPKPDSYKGTLTTIGALQYSWDFGSSASSGEQSFSNLQVGQVNIINVSVILTLNWNDKYYEEEDQGDWLRDENGLLVLDENNKPIWVPNLVDVEHNVTRTGTETLTQSLNVYTHPAEFHLTYGDTLDKYLSASQWNNAFSTAILLYLSWKQQSPLSFSNVVVKKGDIIGTAAYNQAARALGQPEINSHDRIRTFLFETLIGELNNGV